MYMHFFMLNFNVCMISVGIPSLFNEFLFDMISAVERASLIAKQADIIAALTLDVLKGTTSAFDSGKIRTTKKNRKCVQIIS